MFPLPVYTFLMSVLAWLPCSGMATHMLGLSKNQHILSVKEESIMPMLALPAHFDGEQIYLDEPFDLEPNTKLIVTILPELEPDNEHESWLRLSGQRLQDAYGEKEPEYSSDLLKEVNPDYEGK